MWRSTTNTRMRYRNSTIRHIKKKKTSNQRTAMCIEKGEFQLERRIKEVIRKAHVTIVNSKNLNQMAQKGPNQPVKVLCLGYSPIRTGVQ